MPHHASVLSYINFYFFPTRCEIIEKNDEVRDFLNAFLSDLKSLTKHDFLAQVQSTYFQEKKATAEEGEFIVCLDFAFVVQDAIQSHHWSNSQATVHPFVIYYRENDQLKHISFVIISEKTTHDAASVNLFIKKMILFLKQQFGDDHVKKVSYFSDGAGSQYKNKYNFKKSIVA